MPKIRILSYDPSGNAKSESLEGKIAVIDLVWRDGSDQFILRQRDVDCVASLPRVSFQIDFIHDDFDHLLAGR